MNANPVNNQVPRENPLLSLFFNILIPVFVLNQLTKRLGEDGPLIALLVGLSFPILYGVWDFWKRRQMNFISGLGIINILVTGGFALYKLEGIWFAVKEAAFPLLMGIVVWVTTFSEKTLIEAMLLNPQVMNTKLIEERVESANKKLEFRAHIQKCNFLLACSFFISSLLNFVLAYRIFQPINTALAETERAGVLNEQIAQMTWLSVVVITIPLMIFLIAILWYLLKGIHQMTSLTLDEVMHSH